jgi:DNA-binding NarL/FixJ family response regulator
MKIVFADDHKMVREGVIRFLEKLNQDVTVSQADDYESLIALLSQEDEVDLVLVDLRMPGMESLSQIADICQAAGKAPIVILSGMLDPHVVRESLKHGASGCIPKTYGGAAMINALKLILAGEKHVPSFVASERRDKLGTGIGGTSGVKNDIFDTLTDRQREVLHYLVEGRSNRQIADELQVTPATVKFHLKTIYAKLSVTNRTQAVRVASQSGFES